MSAARVQGGARVPPQHAGPGAGAGQLQDPGQGGDPAPGPPDRLQGGEGHGGRQEVRGQDVPPDDARPREDDGVLHILQVHHRGEIGYNNNDITFRNSFTVFSEEVFLLFSEKMLADFLQFLEIESSSEIKLSKSRLQNLFMQHYAWKENSTSDVSFQRIDDKCQGLYELSIYKTLKQVNTFSFKGENYPLIFKLKI